MTLFTAMIAFCPCVPGHGMDMDDCCQSTGLSIGEICCARDAGQTSMISPVPTLTPLHPPALFEVVVIAPVQIAWPAGARHSHTRSIVARTILRV